MRIDVISIFPQMFDAIAEFGVTGRAVRSGLLRLAVWNPRDFSADKHRRVDDRPYGGGPGMVMCAEPLMRAIEAARAGHAAGAPVAYLSPQGRRLDQRAVLELAARPGLIMIAGRYEGVDERVLEATVTEEWSIGDYVLSGGELAAMVVIDAVARWLPGVLGDESSAAEDSFAGGLLDYAHYTRPEVYAGREVPDVLLSGDHDAIRRWRLKDALGRTLRKRPELFEGITLSDEERRLLDEVKQELKADFGEEP